MNKMTTSKAPMTATITDGRGVRGARVSTTTIDDGRRVWLTISDPASAPFSELIPDTVVAFDAPSTDALRAALCRTRLPGSVDAEAFLRDVGEVHHLLVHLQNGGALDDMAETACELAKALVARLGDHVERLGCAT